ncbi:MAG TPA: hypothetical protein VKE70_07915 [Candidatus Solibacter sp.]|nr:hypothetical protein [Candidatus Solibacter sp.]
MTAKELTRIATENSLTFAEINKAIGQLLRNSLSLHKSIKSLEATAVAHDAQIDELIEGHKALQKEWQVYLRRQPRT